MASVGWSASISTTLPRWVIDVAHRAVAEVEHRAQHRLLGRCTVAGLALAVQLDGAAQCVGSAPSASGVRSMRTFISRRKKREIQATLRAIGPRMVRVTMIDGARVSATRSARSSAQVLGMTSAKITTMTPMTSVA